MLEVMGSNSAAGEEKFRCPNMFSFVSFAEITLGTCTVLRIGMLTGPSPVQGESPPVQVKEPYSSLRDYLLAFIMQSRCVAYNPRERV